VDNDGVRDVFAWCRVGRLVGDGDGTRSADGVVNECPHGPEGVKAREMG